AEGRRGGTRPERAARRRGDARRRARRLRPGGGGLRARAAAARALRRRARPPRHASLRRLWHLRPAVGVVRREPPALRERVLLPRKRGEYQTAAHVARRRRRPPYSGCFF